MLLKYYDLLIIFYIGAKHRESFRLYYQQFLQEWMIENQHQNPMFQQQFMPGMPGMPGMMPGMPMMMQPPMQGMPMGGQPPRFPPGMPPPRPPPMYFGNPPNMPPNMPLGQNPNPIAGQDAPATANP